MRLIECNDDGFSLTKDLVGNVPPYAILSHTWGLRSQEVTFRDMKSGVGKEKAGYKKIEFCARQAKEDGLRHIWVDTCCIDKSDSAELDDAINSMFRWYHDAARCYVYLSDVLVSHRNGGTRTTDSPWESSFRASKWFTRGWTLPELLAPASVEFFTEDGKQLGDKKTLERQIHEITGIPTSALRGSALSDFDVEERFRWADTRQTTYEEDSAYCLLGIFGVSMQPNYNEGKKKSMGRLKEEIENATSREGVPRRQRGKLAGTRVWLVPFEKNKHFTGREPELQKLRQTLFTGQQTAKVAVTGLGGVGKTHLALEFIHQIATERPGCSIFWLSALSSESLRRSYVDVANELGISTCDENNVDVRKRVKYHLSNENSGQWLLVFDNADDIGVWIEKPTPESPCLLDCLPRSQHGSIIFTTRNKKTAVDLAGSSVIELLEMDKECGKELLRNYLVDKDLLEGRRGEQEAADFLSRLAYLPLAIIQAATYVNQNTISLGDYVALLDEQEEDVIDLLSEDFEDEGRYHESNNPVATTWVISFERIRQYDPLAAEYMSFLACMNSQDIPLSFLPPGQSRTAETSALGTLRGYSFVSVQSSCQAVSVHRLVHLAMRSWLRKEEELVLCTQKAIERLLVVLRGCRYSNLHLWRPYMPHISFLLKSTPAGRNSDGALDLRTYFAIFLAYSGYLLEAQTALEDLINDALKLWATGREGILQKALESMGNLAHLFAINGRLERAEAMQALLVSIYANALGVSHERTLWFMALQAKTSQKRGRWDEAEKIQEQILEAFKGKDGAENSIGLLDITGELAETYGHQGKIKEQEKLLVQAIEGLTTLLGPNDLPTLYHTGNLARLRRDQGRYREAEELYLRIKKAYETKSEPLSVPSIVNTDELAQTISLQGRFDEAVGLLEPLLDRMRAEYVTEYMGIPMVMRNLAANLKLLGRDAEASAIMKDRDELLARVGGEQENKTPHYTASG